MKIKAAHYIQEIIYGGNDGIVTTFAIISSLVGAGVDKSFNPLLIIVLGFANLFADGSSMALGNFLSIRASSDLVNTSKEKSIFHSSIHGIVTFISFCLFGCIPLLPFLILQNKENLYAISIFATLLAFVFLGLVRSKITKKSLIYAVMENLFVGLVAATIGFGFGFGFKNII